MARRVKSTLLGAALGAFGLIGAAAAEPAMWVVKDSDSTLYLFGTVHILRPQTTWRTPAFEAAFKAAEEVWFEIDLASASDQNKIRSLAPLFIDPSKPLSQKLDAAQLARVRAVATKLGLPAANLEALRPWFVAISLIGPSLQTLGLDPESGIENVLSKEIGARSARALETIDQQFGFFASMSEAEEIGFLMESIEGIEEGAAELDRLINAWARGDDGELVTILNQEMREQFPKVYDTLILKRNLAWVEQIKTEMAKSGVDFIAVGAGHLVGEDGVPALLRKAGLSVTQVQPKP